MHNIISKLAREDFGGSSGGIRKMRKQTEERKSGKDYTKDRQRRRADEKRAHLNPKPNY